jgi:hypothetical protein
MVFTLSIGLRAKCVSPGCGGKYTEEEFETALGKFKATNKPSIVTYFKATAISTGTANKSYLMSLWAFQESLALGHYPTVYKNIDQLKLHFSQQLDKLAANGFIEFKPDQGRDASAGGINHEANLTGSGAIAQGPQATAVGGAVYTWVAVRTRETSTPEPRKTSILAEVLTSKAP